MSSRSWRVVQVGIVVILMLVLGRQIWLNWGDVQAAPLTLALRPGWVLLSLTMTWLVYAGLIEGWRRLVGGWGPGFRWFTAARIWVLSSIAALIPLRVWGFAGMAVMSEKAGVPSAAALGAAVVMQVLSIGAGVGVAAFAIGRELHAARPDAGIGLSLLGVAALGSLVVIHSRTALRILWRVLRRNDPPPTPPAWSALLEAALINGAAWVGYGVALWALGRGVLPETTLPLRLAIGVYAVSYIAGYLAVFTPGGIGVREVFITALLTPTLGAPAAIALSIASRLAVTVTQAGAALPFLFVKEPRRDAP
jgi:uncharacterized membrane protein YbhN (UPF0104 family)